MAESGKEKSGGLHRVSPFLLGLFNGNGQYSSHTAVVFFPGPYHEAYEVIPVAVDETHGKKGWTIELAVDHSVFIQN